MQSWSRKQQHLIVVSHVSLEWFDTCQYRIMLLCFLLTGAVYPETGPLNKENGRMVADAFGPISSWYISYNSNEPVMVACTAAASYQLSKPASAYKKVHAALEEQTMLTWHVLQVGVACDASWCDMDKSAPQNLSSSLASSYLQLK